MTHRQTDECSSCIYFCVSSSGGSEPSRYERNEKIDQKISLYSGDITKLEIDAIVNAGRCVRVCVCVSECS